MSVNTKRDLGDLALMYEHFVKDNGYKNAHADNFRSCRTDNTLCETCENGIRIGIVWAYLNTAVHNLQEKGTLSVEKQNVVEKAVETLTTNRSFQGIVDVLNDLADCNLAT